MAPGIRATVQFTTADICPIVELSAVTEATIDSVASNVCVTDDVGCTSEFSMEADIDPDGPVEHVFSHGQTHWYRYTHTSGIDCPCECLGQYECAASRYVARDGVLTLVFNTPGYEELQEIVTELRDRFPDMEIIRFVREPVSDQSHDSVLFDRSKLTTRQLEVVQTAYEMGYFDRPRRANATEVARALDIDPTTFSEHLAAAQSKVFADIL